MKRLFAVLRAEGIKWWRNWPLVIAFLAPLSQAAFLGLLFWFSDYQLPKADSGFALWYQVNFTAWNFVFMPVSIALMTGLIWDVEGEAKAWKHLRVQPVRPSHHYTVKWLSTGLFFLLSQGLLFAALLGEGLLLRGHLASLEMGPLQLPLLLRLSCASLAASIPMIALHTWISSRFRGLGTPLAVALGGTWLTAQGSAWPLGLGLSPWGLATRAVDTFLKGQPGFGVALIGGGLVTVLFLVCGTFDFLGRKELRD